MSELTYARVMQALERLKLTRMQDVLDQCAQRVATEHWTYVDFLDQLLEAELAARAERDVVFKTKMAHFPFVKTLDQFDFAAQPSINERQVRDLAAARFVAHGENVLLLGPPGVGKTHLAIGLGLACIAHGLTVYFLTMAELVDLLQRDVKLDRVPQRLQLLCKPKLLIVDEVGYVPLEPLAARFLFQVVSRRYLKGSMVITSNKSYGAWDHLVADQVLASALLDRLLHVSTTINIRGQSYRLREKRQAGVFHDLPELTSGERSVG